MIIVDFIKLLINILNIKYDILIINFLISYRDLLPSLNYHYNNFYNYVIGKFYDLMNEHHLALPSS